LVPIGIALLGVSDRRPSRHPPQIQPVSPAQPLPYDLGSGQAGGVFRKSNEAGTSGPVASLNFVAKASFFELKRRG
jgi:hypothetical protein